MKRRTLASLALATVFGATLPLLGPTAAAQATANCPSDLVRQVGQGDSVYHICQSMTRDARGMNPRQCSDLVMAQLKDTYGVQKAKDVRPYMKFCMPTPSTLNRAQVSTAGPPIISDEPQPLKGAVANESLGSNPFITASEEVSNEQVLAAIQQIVPSVNAHVDTALEKVVAPSQDWSMRDLIILGAVVGSGLLLALFIGWRVHRSMKKTAEEFAAARDHARPIVIQAPRGEAAVHMAGLAKAFDDGANENTQLRNELASMEDRVLAAEAKLPKPAPDPATPATASDEEKPDELEATAGGQTPAVSTAPATAPTQGGGEEQGELILQGGELARQE